MLRIYYSKRLMQKLLTPLLQGKNLKSSQVKKAFTLLLTGKLSEPEAKALLLLLATKGETAEELSEVIRLVKKLEGVQKNNFAHLVDTCGTGGDHSQSFNISTVSAFVIAGAGGQVAKHGNRSISSRAGSSDLMEALGVKLDAPRTRMIQAIRKYGIGYFHAPFYHPVFAKVQPLRKKLGVRTLFNLMGPFLNPMELKAQVIGVARSEYVRLFADVFTRARLKTALVCHSQDGLDEISTSAETLMAEIRGKTKKVRLFNPRSAGFKRAAKQAYRGGNIAENKKLALALLQGKLKGPKRDIVLLNAAAGLYAAGLAKSLNEGIKKAAESIDSGRALRALRGLVDISNKRTKD